MIPYPGRTLTDIALRIVNTIAPDAQSNFVQADAALISGLLLTLGQDYERAVDNRLQDIAAMRSIFARFTDIEPLGEELGAFVGRVPESFKLRDVNDVHAAGFDLLIRLHAWSEQHDADLDVAIWELLRAHSERNKFDMPGP
jgi:hypothetical protein